MPPCALAASSASDHPPTAAGTGSAAAGVSVALRHSVRGLARELRMSPPAIGERIARLERAGGIRGDRVAMDRQLRRRWLLAGPTDRFRYLFAVRRGKRMRRHLTYLQTLRRI